ncbi:MAG: hypothetical protein PVF70_13795 [Anaerolineales bacterium]|jgi:hypothetical protein
MRFHIIAGDALATRAVETRFLFQAAPNKIYLSTHDTCDHALARMSQELKAKTQVLKAGATCRF